MRRKNGTSDGAGGQTGDEADRELARAAEDIAALSPRDREQYFQLVRNASAIPLSDSDIAQVAALLWANRGPGAIETLKAGFRIFEKAPPRPKGRARSMESLSKAERAALLASLLADRHVPAGYPAD